MSNEKEVKFNKYGISNAYWDNMTCGESGADCKTISIT